MFLVLRIDTLAAILHASAGAKDLVYLVIRQRKSSGFFVFYTCLRCYHISHLFFKAWEQIEKIHLF